MIDFMFLMGEFIRKLGGFSYNAQYIINNQRKGAYLSEQDFSRNGYDDSRHG